MSRTKIKFWAPGFRSLLFTGLVLGMMTGCQRDDICSETTQTTPMLLISFFDAEDPETSKPVSNLSVRERSYDTLIYNRQSISEIRIPLRVDSGTTAYEFISNTPAEADEDEDEADEAETDRLTFSYNPEEIYISRACSFKVNFQDLTALPDPGNTWIRSITIVEEIIENETSAHIHIYH